MKIRIAVGPVSIAAELNDSSTAKKVAAVLPITSDFSTWGDEIYFSIPVDAELDHTAQKEVQIGDLGYWPTGKAFCIFFGPTPGSPAGKILPASAVNILGRVLDDAKLLKSVINERKIELNATTE
jgi:uncharacterized protein